MVSENKISKYLIYAIGEIVLVVIGILIALYINNWNQERLQRVDELKSLEFLKAEFEGNLQKFEDIQMYQTSRFDAINYILFSDLSTMNLAQIDSLHTLTLYSWTYNPSFSTYNSLVSSGKINQFSNDSLKIRLSDFKDLVADYTEDEENLWDHSRDYLFEQEINNNSMLLEAKVNLRQRNSREKINDKSLYLDLFSNPEYRNTLTFAILHLELIIGEADLVRRELLELNDMIEENIDRLSK